MAMNFLKCGDEDLIEWIRILLRRCIGWEVTKKIHVQYHCIRVRGIKLYVLFVGN